VRKIAVLNQKGGVGKTTTVANVSAALAAQGQKVLVMDMDPQAHLTIHLGADLDPDALGVYEVLTSGTPVTEAARSVRDNLFLLGASIDLVGAESELVSEVGREIILKQALELVEDQYDYLIIDCPPSLGLLALNALAAVDEVMIPIQPHFLALQGFSRLLQTVTLVQTRINPKLRVSAILMCMFDSRTSLSNEVKEDIQHFLSAARDSDQPWSHAKVVPVHVRRNIKLAEAPSHGQTIFEYESNCNGAMDYQAVAEFLHTQCGVNAQPSPVDDIPTEPEPQAEEPQQPVPQAEAETTPEEDTQFTQPETETEVENKPVTDGV
jgi:chromosome partitioning protein